MGVSGDGFQRGAINGFSLAFAEIEKSDLDFSIFSRGLDKRRDEEGRWASYCSRPTDGKLLIIFRAFQPLCCSGLACYHFAWPTNPRPGEPDPDSKPIALSGLQSAP